jgi:Permuted papain-like amidase enzyme, YaeF/YiiX, C92 family
MNGRIWKFTAIVSCIFLGFNCKQNNENAYLQEGDLLFQDLDCGDLCNAIEAVTVGVNGKNFSHCAMVVKVNDTLKVVEAIGDKVQINALKHFFERSNDITSISNITVTRLKREFRPLIANAVIFAKQQVGQPYDDEFILNNGKWYCSELIYEAFLEADKNKLFTLQPMTFKDPKTKTYFPAWVDYYKQINKKIPEGELGINPGLISLSDKTEVVELDSIVF